MTAHAHAGPRLSDTVAGLAKAGAGERVRLADIMAALGGRSFAILMLIFSLPNAIGLGTIPGLSTIFGVPQLFLAVQMVLGFKQPWLPQWLLEKSIPRSDIAKISDRAEPYLVKFERFLRQRWLFMTSPAAERILGVVFGLMAMIVSLPIPFGNQPPAVAMAFLSVGIAERDGVYVALGLVVAVGATALAGGVVAAFAATIIYVFRTVFG